MPSQKQPQTQKQKIIVGLGSCGIAAGAKNVYQKFEKRILEAGLADRVSLGITSCLGMCYGEPLVEIISADGKHSVYGNVSEKLADRIMDEHIIGGNVIVDSQLDFEQKGSPAADFMGRQKKIVLKNCGVIDPESLDAYLATGGYSALKQAFGWGQEKIIDEVKKSGLRGRGGAGFTTGMKWQFARQAKGEKKYIICNADEGDPGAFMDRSTLEGDPHAVLEGMIIAGFAIGANHAYIYCRAEYPLAIRRLKIAIQQCLERNLLGKNILGSGFDFEVRIKEGAGAFVCGEETALMASIEGRRGMPRKRPPFPAQSGLYSCPTNINNVETYANVPWILLQGSEAFAAIGTEKSKGTKVFALAGKVKRGGLVEVPMGITIREIVEEIGGGSNTGKPLKAVQMGGPSGGCIPASLFGTKVDYDEVVRTGAIMGSGGMLVMDETTCMVDVARFFLNFTQLESCGKCTFCRIGTKRMLEILNRITAGEGAMEDIEKLESLSQSIIKGSLCGLGQTAPNPVLTTLNYFRNEYEEHIHDKRCRAGVCRALIRYDILDSCTGCTLCAKLCPAKAITGERKKLHVIDQKLCTKCSRCFLCCKFDAIRVE